MRWPAARPAGWLAGAFPEHVIRAAAAAGLDAGFYIGGAVGLLGALAVFLLVRPAPADTREPALVS